MVCHPMGDASLTTLILRGHIEGRCQSEGEGEEGKRKRRKILVDTHAQSSILPMA